MSRAGRALILAPMLAAVAAPALAAGFAVTSPDFRNGGAIAMRQVFGQCGGQNVSPALSWSGEPAGTHSFAVTLFDPDAPGGSGWWHWSVFNIPASVHSLPEGAGSGGSAGLPPGAVQGRNDFGSGGYGGPCPPPGPAHHYRVTIYAVKVPAVPLDAAAPGAAVGAALKADALATAELVGMFGRSR